MTDRVGQQLGNYRLSRLLGRGGFAEVYLGEHVYLKTPAAIKLLQGKLANEQDLQAFLYEWLCGARPFHGSFTELCTQHMFASPPPLREKIPTISPAVEQVVLTALQKDPHRRFASMQAFAAALEEASRPRLPLLLPEEFSTAKSSSLPESITISPPLSVSDSAQSTAIAGSGNLVYSTPLIKNISSSSQPSAQLTPSPPRGVLVDFLFPSHTSQHIKRNALLIVGGGSSLFLYVLLLVLLFYFLFIHR